MAIADPWSDMALGACIPISSRPSQKARLIGRATMTIGTAGFGMVYAVPTLCNDAGGIITTTSAYTGNHVTSLTLATVGITRSSLSGGPALANFQIADDQNVPAYYGRMVACGLKCTYTGTSQNSGGLYSMCVDPQHDNLNNTVDILLRPETVVKRVGTAPIMITTGPLDDRENGYGEIHEPVYIQRAFPFSNNSCFSLTDNTTGGASMCIKVTGTPGNTFHVEMVSHVEYIGRSAAGYLTHTHADAQGTETVIGASLRVPMKMVTGQSSMQAMRSAVNEVLTENAPAIARAGAAYIGRAFGYGGGNRLTDL